MTTKAQLETENEELRAKNVELSTTVEEFEKHVDYLQGDSGAVNGTTPRNVCDSVSEFFDTCATAVVDAFDSSVKYVSEIPMPTVTFGDTKPSA